MIRLTYINSIPHWTDGKLALPIMAGAQLTQEEIDALTGGTGGGQQSVPEVALANWVGRELYDIGVGQFGILERRQERELVERPPGSGIMKPAGPYRWVYSMGGRHLTPGTTLLDLANRALIAPSGDFNSARVTTATEAMLNAIFGIGEDQGVSADTAASIAQQQAELAAQVAENEKQRQFEAEQERLDREAQAELERLRQENEMKRARLAEAGGLARTAAEVQQRARQLIAELTGVDPIRGAIAAQGGVQRGTTPAQGFTSQLQGIASAPIPTVSESATIPEIEQTISALQGQQQLPVAPALGFAEGGAIQPMHRMPDGSMMPDIEMQQGADGAFSMAPQTEGQPPMAGAPESPQTGIQQGTTKRAILVGEAGSQIAPGTEVMLVDSANPGRVEIVPLVSSAQTGGVVDIPNIQDIVGPLINQINGSTPATTQPALPSGTPSFSTIQQSLAPIFKNLGFTDLPQTFYDPQGYLNIRPAPVYTPGGWGPSGSLETAKRLGFNPRLVVDQFGSGYWQGPEGQWHYISSPELFKQMGLRPQDALRVQSSDIAANVGSPLTAPPQLVENPIRNYPQQAMPLVAPVGQGQLLFDPRLLAGIWRFLDPATRNVLTSAFGTAGYGTPEQAQATIEEAVRFFTPTGTATRPGGARLG